MKLLTVSLLLCAMAFGQEQDHKAKLTIQEIIGIIADYDVRHGKQQPFFEPSYGATQFNTVPPEVWIFSGDDHEGREATVIHEFYHVKCKKLHIECSEEQVRQAEAEIYTD